MFIIKTLATTIVRQCVELHDASSIVGAMRPPTLKIFLTDRRQLNSIATAILSSCKLQNCIETTSTKQQTENDFPLEIMIKIANHRAPIGNRFAARGLNCLRLQTHRSSRFSKLAGKRAEQFNAFLWRRWKALLNLFQRCCWNELQLIAHM